MNLNNKRYDTLNQKSMELVSLAELINMTIFENNEQNSENNDKIQEIQDMKP